MNFTLGYNEKSFSRDVIDRWGSLADELVDHENLLHLPMATLSRLCKSNRAERVGALKLLDEILSRRDAVSEIENAVAISLLDWPELRALAEEVAPRVSDVVRKQWETFGSNA